MVSGRSLALAPSLAGSRTHCSLFLHRLHSLTASLRRLTNRSLLLLSSLSLSLSPLSSLCLLHASNKLVAAERASGPSPRGLGPRPRARGGGGIPELRVPPAQFGHRAPLHPSIPLAAVRPSVPPSSLPPLHRAAPVGSHSRVERCLTMVWQVESAPRPPREALARTRSLNQ